MEYEDLTDKLETFELSAADYAKLSKLETDDQVEAFWRKLAPEMEFYPQTVDWNPSQTSFRARPIEKSHSVEDLDNGWTFNDWMTGWGPGEKWRFTLNRKLKPLESRRVNVRLSQHETWDVEAEQYDLDLTLEMLKSLCDDDLHVVRCRKELIEATEIKDGWIPVFPGEKDIEATDGD